MSRKDGFSTNAETLADFRDVSRQVFVEAYEREMGDNMHPGFEDKPLTSLYLNVASETSEPELGRVSVLTEKMTVQPIDKDIVKHLDAHPSLSKLPHDIKERYEKIGANLSAIALSKDLLVASVLPMEAVYASYAVYLSDDTVKTAGIFMQKPDRMSTVAGKYFAMDALRYVRSDSFSGQQEDDDEDPDMDMSHYFGLDMEPKLPLNGFEKREFLAAYRREMIRQYNRVQAYLQNQPETNKDEELTEMMNKFLVVCAAAVERADAILERRND